MIDLTVLQNKKTFIKVNGDKVVDLIRRSVSFLNVKVNQGKQYIVEEGLQMRGDLVARAFYQSSSIMCILLKYNGISNPFSINVNDIIQVPDGAVLSAMSTRPDDINGMPDNWTTSTRKKKKAGSIKPSSKIDKARIEYLVKSTGQTIAPPNIAKDNSVKIANGKIVFGADVTSVKKDDCPDPISRTKLQAALLKNKLFS